MVSNKNSAESIKNGVPQEGLRIHCRSFKVQNIPFAVKDYLNRHILPINKYPRHTITHIGTSDAPSSKRHLKNYIRFEDNVKGDTA